MDPDSEEFQDASQAAARKIKHFLLELSTHPGQTDGTSLTGAMAAIAELQIECRPKGMDPAEALSRGAQTMLYYGVQFIEGHAIDYDRVTN